MWTINLIYDGAQRQIANMQSIVQYGLLNFIPLSHQSVVAAVTIFASGADSLSINLVRAR